MHPAQENTISTDLVNGHRPDLNFDSPDDSQSQSISEALNLNGEDGLHQSYGQRINETHLDLSSTNVSVSFEYGKNILFFFHERLQEPLESEKKQALLLVENIFCDSKQFGFASNGKWSFLNTIYFFQLVCYNVVTKMFFELGLYNL